MCNSNDVFNGAHWMNRPTPKLYEMGSLEDGHRARLPHLWSDVTLLSVTSYIWQLDFLH